MTAIDSFITPKNDIAIRSKNAFSGRHATSAMASSESGEHIGISASLENVSERNNKLHVLKTNDWTRIKFLDEISESSIPDTHFDRQTHTHHLVTAQTAQTKYSPEFLIRGILKPREQPLHQHQKLSTQVSLDTNLPMVGRTPGQQASDSSNSFNQLAEAVAGIAAEQRRKAPTRLKTVSTNTLIFDGKNEKIELFKTYFTQCSKCNQK